MQNLDFSSIPTSLGYLFGHGMAVTLFITVLAGTFGMILGAVLAVTRISPRRWISLPATIYINTFRSLPLILIIFAFFFLMPYIGAWVTLPPHPVAVGPLRAAVISFTLFEAAYFAEIIRSGIQSISRGQSSAGNSIGLSDTQVMRYIILPQAFRNMIPPLLMRNLILFQDTSLVYVVSLTDFLGAASNLGQRDGLLTEMYIFAAATYFIICFVISKSVDRLEKRLQVIK